MRNQNQSLGGSRARRWFGYLWHEWIGERWRPIAPAFARPNPAEWSDKRITAAWLGHATVLINSYRLAGSAARRRWLLWSQHVWRGRPWRRSWPGLDYCGRGLVGWRLAYRLTGLIEGVEFIAENGGAPERGIYNYLTVPV